MNYNGIFKQILESGIPNLTDVKFYQEYFADFYDNLISIDEFELNLYKKQFSSKHHKTVLELACGSGRIGMALAEAGYDVTGIDLSPDMLHIYEKKIKEKSDRVKKHISIKLADITNFKFENKFDAVILPATSICLLENDESIYNMFQCIDEHLNKGGIFIFDARIIKDSSKFPKEGKPIFHQWNAGKTINFAILQEFFFGDIFIVNIYGEEIDDAKTFRKIGYTKKRNVTEESIHRAINSSRMQLAKEITSKHTLDNEYVKYFVLEK